MIFPEDYKTVGITHELRPGDPIYFATEYLISSDEETVLYRVRRKTPGEGFMRDGVLEEMARGIEIVKYEKKIDTRNRAKLIELAGDLCHGGVNTVIFKGPDEHVTFVHHPDPSAITEIEIMDVTPPDPPWLVYVISRLEECGVLGDLTVKFRRRTLNLRAYEGEDVYFPCRASGLGRSLDSDRVEAGQPKIVGCEVSREIFLAMSPARDHRFQNICPVTGGMLEPKGPFITRCCKSERRGLITIKGHRGVVVHWGDGPHKVAEAIRWLVEDLRKLR